MSEVQKPERPSIFTFLLEEYKLTFDYYKAITVSIGNTTKQAFFVCSALIGLVGYIFNKFSSDSIFLSYSIQIISISGIIVLHFYIVTLFNYRKREVWIYDRFNLIRRSFVEHNLEYNISFYTSSPQGSINTFSPNASLNALKNSESFFSVKILVALQSLWLSLAAYSFFLYFNADTFFKNPIANFFIILIFYFAADNFYTKQAKKIFP